MIINELEIVKRYDGGDSPYKIASDLSTSATTVRRVLIKHKGVGGLRSKGAAQKLALKNGRASHPTKGRKRTPEEKSKISSSAVKFWETASQETKDWRSEVSKKIWESIPKDKIADMRDKAIKAIQQAAKTGSKLEKEVCGILSKLGYVYETHRTVFMISTKNLEVDVYIPSIQTIIEIDGLSHFEPIWGEDALKKQISFDTQKEGIIRSKGFNLVRIENKCSSFAIKRLKDLHNNLESVLKELSNAKGEYKVIKYE